MDHLQIVPMEHRYFHSYYAALGAVMAEGRYLSRVEVFPFEDAAWFVDQILGAGAPFLVVLDGERLVGWADANRMEGRPNAGYLGMGLLDGYREKGLGRRLLEALLERCRAFGDAEMVLDVRASNERAIRLYQSLGFVLEEIQRGAITLFEETGHGFADSGKMEDVWRMSRPLSD